MSIQDSPDVPAIPLPVPSVFSTKTSPPYLEVMPFAFILFFIHEKLKLGLCLSRKLPKSCTDSPATLTGILDYLC